MKVSKSSAILFCHYSILSNVAQRSHPIWIDGEISAEYGEWDRIFYFRVTLMTFDIVLVQLKTFQAFVHIFRHKIRKLLFENVNQDKKIKQTKKSHIPKKLK